MHYQTFYDRVCLEKGMGFTEYSQQKKEQGNSILRKVQFKKASEGDNTLLIWLGKNRLKQERKEKEFESSLRQKEEGAKQSTYNIIVPNDLAIGANIPAQKVPDKANTSPE
jgi:hypothetical protein